MTLLLCFGACGEPKGEWERTDYICLPVDELAETCPTPEEAMADDELFFNGYCSSEIREITGPGVLNRAGPEFTRACCYPGEGRDLSPGCVY